MKHLMSVGTNWPQYGALIEIFLLGVPGWLSRLSVQLLIFTQVMISQFMGSSLQSGSELIAQSLEPALDSVSTSLCPFPTRALSLSLSKINKTFKKMF